MASRNPRRIPQASRPTGFDPATWRAGRAWSRAYARACRQLGVGCMDLPTLGAYYPILAATYRRIAPAIRSEYARIGATRADANVARTYCTRADHT